MTVDPGTELRTIYNARAWAYGPDHTVLYGESVEEVAALGGGKLLADLKDT